MDFIKRIGQRKFSQYLFYGACGVSLLIYALKFAQIGNSIKPSVVAIILGTIIFALPNLLLSIAAHKTTIYRVMSLFISGLILSLNSILFIIGLLVPQINFFLFIVCMIETILSIIFVIFVSKAEKQKKIEKGNKSSKTKESIKEKELNYQED